MFIVHVYFTPITVKIAQFVICICKAEANTKDSNNRNNIILKYQIFLSLFAILKSTIAVNSSLVPSVTVQKELIQLTNETSFFFFFLSLKSEQQDSWQQLSFKSLFRGKGGREEGMAKQTIAKKEPCSKKGTTPLLLIRGQPPHL